MEIENEKNHILIKATEKTFKEFYSAFVHQGLHKVSTHKIVQFSNNMDLVASNIALFLSVANEHKKSGISFVVICNGIAIDEIPDEINVVPSVTEAEDLLEMEAIERDLGF